MKLYHAKIMLSGEKEEKNSDNEKMTAGKFWLFHS
jgi:hypothetical protein